MNKMSEQGKGGEIQTRKYILWVTNQRDKLNKVQLANKYQL